MSSDATDDLHVISRKRSSLFLSLGSATGDKAAAARRETATATAFFHPSITSEAANTDGRQPRSRPCLAKTMSQLLPRRRDGGAAPHLNYEHETSAARMPTSTHTQYAAYERRARESEMSLLAGSNRPTDRDDRTNHRNLDIQYRLFLRLRSTTTHVRRRRRRRSHANVPEPNIPACGSKISQRGPQPAMDVLSLVVRKYFN